MKNFSLHYNRLLLSELRLVCISESPEILLSDLTLTKALTINEELINLGYTLTPEDLIKLASSENLNSFLDDFKKLPGDIKAAPMYPDFPEQVIEISEAQFRMHQLTHYFSTYVLKSMGFNVSKGWLPFKNEKQDAKTESDTRLLDSKVISLIDEKSLYKIPAEKILSKKERMNDKEKEIVKISASHLTPEEISGFAIPFKQNMLYFFYAIFSSEKISSDEKTKSLKSLCQHTGDVWKCMDYTLTREKFHFRTSQKKLFVKLLEQYPVQDFTENLILSNKKASRILLMIKYLDFNNYSRSSAHKEAVKNLREGKLKSWESQAKYLVENKSPQALEYIEKRPGTMLRMVTYLLRNGYGIKDIENSLLKSAEKLSTQTLLTLIYHFGHMKNSLTETIKKSTYLNHKKETKLKEDSLLFDMLKNILKENLKKVSILKDKKIFLNLGKYNLEQCTIETNNKSKEGGYIKSGLAYKIPKGTKYIRFFVYWNDKKCPDLDVDLHAEGITNDNELISIGWNYDYKQTDSSTQQPSIVFSGDIACSDSAEYIDVSIDSDISVVFLSVNLYAGKNSFKEVEECYTGCMAVDKAGREIKLYNPENCFFTHYLTGDYKFLHYGYLDINTKSLVFKGDQNYFDDLPNDYLLISFSLKEYLDILFKANNCTITENPEEADFKIIMEKPSEKNELSLIDNNFFMD